MWFIIFYLYVYTAAVQNFIDSDFCRNYLHTLCMFACLLQMHALFNVYFLPSLTRTIYLVTMNKNIDCFCRFFRISFNF